VLDSDQDDLQGRNAPPTHQLIHLDQVVYSAPEPKNASINYVIKHNYKGKNPID
jgi:hypothetical protein